MDKHVKLLNSKENLHHWIWGYISRNGKDSQGHPCATMEAYKERRGVTPLTLHISIKLR
jgi:hypothetical protein